MIESKFNNYLMSKTKLIKEEDEKSKDSKDKKEPTVKYKENISIKEIPGVISGFKSYMGLFAEALNCMDSIYAIARQVDPEASEVKGYESKKSEIGVVSGKSEDKMNSAWEKIMETSKGLLNVIPVKVKKNDVIKKYTEEKEALEKGKDGKKLKEEVYKRELEKLRKKYSEMIDPAQIITLSKMKKATELYYAALVNFYNGSKAEVEFVKNKAKEKEDESIVKDFFNMVGDSAETIILSKKLATKNIKTYESESILTEDIGQGVKKIFGKSKDEPVGETDTVTLKYVADNLIGSIIGLAQEIDNVIAYKTVVQGRETESGKRAAAEAKSSAEELIKFVNDSYKYVVGVEDLLKNDEDNKTTHKEVKEKLDEIAQRLESIGRTGGILEKWKKEVLGAKREKTASGANLERGRELMLQAKQTVDEVISASNLDAEIKDKEVTALFKKAVNALRGTSDKSDGSGKISRIKQRGDYKTFSKNPTDKEKETVKGFQERLKSMGQLSSGYKEGEFDEKTKKSSNIAMKYLGVVTGKTYDDSEEAFRDFQVDHGMYGDNIDKLAEILKK